MPRLRRRGEKGSSPRRLAAGWLAGAECRPLCLRDAVLHRMPFAWTVLAGLRQSQLKIGARAVEKNGLTSIT